MPGQRMQNDSLKHVSKTSTSENVPNTLTGDETTSSKVMMQTNGMRDMLGTAPKSNHQDESFGSLNDLYLSESVGTLDSNNDSSRNSPSSGVMSDRVQRIASSIYAEFEAMIEAYGLPVVERLMPLVIGLLENLDELYKDQSAYHEEVYQLREHNTFMVGELEREKERRKQAELRLIHTEDAFDEERKANDAKMEALNLSCRQAELKCQNMKDQLSRIEAKEAEWKKESQRLHEHINELIRSKLDLADQVKFANRPSSGKASYRSTAPVRLGSSAAPTLGIVIGLSSEDATPQHPPQENMYDATSGGFGFDEMPSADMEGGVPLDEELPDDPVTPTTTGDYETGAFAGMRREIDILIKENMELVETKNALNVVKDDLITKLDTLNYENASLRESVSHLTQSRSALQSELASTNQLLSEARHELEEFRDRLTSPSSRFESSLRESGSGSMNRKRFTRAEMARVLSERNQYKERLMELQEAVRLTEILRAGQKGHPELLLGLSASNAGSRSAGYPGGSSVPARPLQTLQNLFSAFLTPNRTDSTTERPDTPTTDNVKLRGPGVSHAWLSLSHAHTGVPIYGWSHGLDSPLSKRSPSTSRGASEGTESIQIVPVPVQCRPIGGIHGKQLEIISALLIPLPSDSVKSEYQIWLVGRGPGSSGSNTSATAVSRGFVGQVHVFELSRFSQPLYSFDLDNGFMPTAAVFVDSVSDVIQAQSTRSSNVSELNPNKVLTFEWEIMRSGFNEDNASSVRGYVLLASNDGRFMVLQVPLNPSAMITKSTDSDSSSALSRNSRILTCAQFHVQNASLVSNCMIPAGGFVCLILSNPSGSSQLSVFRFIDSLRAAESVAGTTGTAKQRHELITIPGDSSATGPVVMALESSRLTTSDPGQSEIVWLGTAGGGNCHGLDPTSGMFIKNMKLPDETPCLHAITVQLSTGYNTIWLAVSGYSSAIDSEPGMGASSLFGDNSRGMARLIAFRADTLTVLHQLDLTAPLCSMIDTEGVTDPIDLTLCRLLAVSDETVDNIWFATRSGIIGRFALPVTAEFVSSQSSSSGNKLCIPNASSLSISCHGYRRPVSDLIPVKIAVSSERGVNSDEPAEYFVIAVGHDYVNLRPKQLIRSPMHKAKSESGGSFALRPMGSGAHIIIWKLNVARG